MNRNTLEDKRVLDLAMKAGQILLENGAEISRVSGTMNHICQAFGVATADNFVLSNGIIMTGGLNSGYYANVRHIPVGGIYLEKIVAVNEMSRKIELGELTLEMAEQRLEEINAMSEGKTKWKVLSSAIGSGAFCYFFGGTFADSLVAFTAGAACGLTAFCLLSPRLSKITKNIIGGLVLTVVCALGYLMGIGQHLNYMIIGSVMPLIPGVAFINAIRELAAGDYISGAVRMLDTLLIFFCIAIGVGLGILFFHQFLGGMGL